MSQFVNSTLVEERNATDPHFAALNHHFQSAIILLEQLGEAWERYTIYQGHPHRRVSSSLLCCAGSAVICLNSWDMA